MPGKKRFAASLALAACLAALSGCGSNEVSGDIPPENATELKAELSAVSDAVARQDCETANSEAQGFVQAVNLLPSTAGAELKQALQDAGANLRLLVTQQCRVTGTTGQTGEQPPPPTTTAPTTTTEETQTTTTTTDGTAPPGDENGGGGPPNGGPPNGGPPNGGPPNGGGGIDGGTGGTGRGSGGGSDE